MNLYERYCRETFDEAGRLTKVSLRWPAEFNFAYDVADEMARQAPEQVAMVWCDPNGAEATFSFSDLARGSDRVARVFWQAGIRPGDRVMVALKRHYEYWFVALALHKLGAVLVPVTHMLTAEDIAYRLDCAPMKALVCTPQNEVPRHVLDAVAGRTQQPLLWTVRETVPGFRNLTEEARREPAAFARIATRAEDPMLMYFTSGTTGQPKGVVHDGTYPLAHIITARHWQQAYDGGLHFSVAETGWGKASWGKFYGQWLVGSAVMVFDFDHFDPKQLVGVINRYGVTTFCAPPTMASLYYNVKLQNADGTPTPVGEIGEVVVVPPEDGSRPAGLFSGYLADPERDAQAWAGGVYHTGDAAWQTADGSYWFHGRFDDIIKTGGYRVGPGEIESVLMEHPAVLECSVVGVPDPLRGQAIQAVVVLTAGQEAGPTLEREIREFCNQKLAAYKWVRQVKFVEALPKTISGKIRRHTLRVP